MKSKIFVLLKAKVKHLLSIRLVDTIESIRNNSICVLWCNDRGNRNNFGDALNPIILDIITEKKISNYFRILNLSSKPVIYFIGSILDNLYVKNAVVCGAGFQKEDARVLTRPSEILAVRGPLTRNIFVKNGIECPEIYGDPAILLPDLIVGTSEKKWDIGIIAHYIDKHILDNIEIITNGLSYKIIDIESPCRDIIDNICSSRYVFSSSLHGLIVSHAYDVPATWIRISKNVIGGDFKFKDYALSVNKKEMPVYDISVSLDLRHGVKMSTLYNTKPNKDKLFLVLSNYFGVSNDFKS